MGNEEAEKFRSAALRALEEIKGIATEARAVLKEIQEVGVKVKREAAAEDDGD